MLSEETKMKGLKVVTLCILLAEAIDEMRGTSLFKGKAKQYLNTIPNLLRKQIRINDDVYEADPTAATNIHRKIDELIVKLAKKDPLDIVMINAIHDYYSKNPKEWQELYELQMTELDT
jgi:hypothetical protein